MNANYKYDLFISYATGNKDIADYIVEKIEARGYSCFIAPRNIATGADYAKEIVNGISNSAAVLLVFSAKSNNSGFVLREINSAVSRNKTVIPLRIENFLPSEAMEFYLGVTHWLDAFPRVLDVHLDSVIGILKGIKAEDAPETKTISIIGPELVKVGDIAKFGYDYQKLTMKEIEIDYLCVPTSKFDMNEEIEGSFDDWQNAAKAYENETSILLVQNDELIGYCDIYPVTDEAYRELIDGKAMIRETMIDLFGFGGEFNAYIAMLAIVPEYATQANYMLICDWVLRHIAEWKKEGVIIKNLGISVYSDMLEKFMLRYGFHFKGTNPAKGKIYETNTEELASNPFVKNRYGTL